MDMARKIIFVDESDYDSRFCHDGGHYRFTDIYRRLDSGKWEISYETSSELDFCPCCGDWGNHLDGDGYSCGDFEQVSTEELTRRIEAFLSDHAGDDNYYIEKTA